MLFPAFTSQVRTAAPAAVSSQAPYASPHDDQAQP